MKISIDMRPTTLETVNEFMRGGIEIQNIVPDKKTNYMVGQIDITDYNIPNGTDHPLILDDRHSKHYIDMTNITDPADIAMIMIASALGYEPAELLNFEFFNTAEDDACRIKE